MSWQRTIDRDREIVKFAGRAKILTIDVLRSRFDISKTRGFVRMDQLVKAGYLASTDIHGYQRVHRATRDGFAWSNLGLAPTKVSRATLPHDIALATLVGRLEKVGFSCVTEREMRAHQRAEADGRYVISTWDRGRIVNHFPDIAFENPRTGSYFAIEVELTTKSRVRRYAILRGFNERVDVNGLGGVLYLAGPDCTTPQLKSIANEIGLDEAFVCTSFNGGVPITELKRLVTMETARVHSR